MGNHPDQFDGDLQVLDDGKLVSGIGSGVSIKGIGTFKFNIEDDTGQVHVIRIPNSLYVPDLKRVLSHPSIGPKRPRIINRSHAGRGWPRMMTALCSNGVSVSS